MFDWIPLIGSYSPVVGFLLIGLPTLLGTALFVGRIKFREATENLHRFAETVLALWALIGYILFSFSVGSFLAEVVFDSLLIGVIFTAIGLITLPLAFIVGYGLTEGNQQMTYVEMRTFSLRWVVTESIIVAIITAICIIAFLTTLAVFTFGAIAGIEVVAGTNIQISDMTSIAIFAGVLISLMIVPLILNGGLD